MEQGREEEGVREARGRNKGGRGEVRGGGCLRWHKTTLFKTLGKRLLIPTWLPLAGRHGLLQPSLQVHLVGWLREGGNSKEEGGRREDVLKEIKYLYYAHS